MIIATTIAQVRAQVAAWKKEGLTVGLVPTMGYLHEGHASLVDEAVRQCDRVVASDFVNPTQFGPNEDLEAYPRDFDRDCALLEEHGCAMVFHPAVEEMYAPGAATYVEILSDMPKQLCGKTRPIHFRGVCTVVSKLFNIVTPDKAFFGQKDAQQLAIIRQMVRDLSYGIEIVGCPIVREADGLAKSSRNTYLRVPGPEDGRRGRDRREQDRRRHDRAHPGPASGEDRLRLRRGRRDHGPCGPDRRDRAGGHGRIHRQDETH